MSVAVGDLDFGGMPNASVSISFEVTIDDPVPMGVTEVANQGFASASNAATVPTDDPNTPEPEDPTVDLLAVGAAQDIPTLSEWSLIWLAVLLVGLGFFESKRRFRGRPMA